MQASELIYLYTSREAAADACGLPLFNGYHNFLETMLCEIAAQRRQFSHVNIDTSMNEILVFSITHAKF